MDPTERDRQIAYGRAALQLGVAPAETIRAVGQQCLASGVDLRQTLLAQRLIGPDDDARILAVLGQPGRSPTHAAAPSASGPPASGSKTRGGASLPARSRLPQPGQTFAGCRVERELARGGMGAVFIAERPGGERVAVKVLLGDAEHGDRLERFRREAEVGRQLVHPGVVRVLDFGEHGGLPYLTMELLEGATPLDEYVAEHPVSWEQRVGLMIRIAEAIQAAHDEGLIHRDLKPDNVLVTPDGAPKVVDFGLARHVDRERLTQSGAVMGTIHYMAPEQVRGETAHADARADVWALGVMLHQLLAGELPFQGATAVEVMRRILEEPAPPVGGQEAPPPPNPERAAAVEGVIAMALRKAKGERYPTAAAFAVDLAAIASGSHETEAARAARRRRGARLLRGVAVALPVLAGLGLAGWVLGPGRGLSSADVAAEARAVDAVLDELAAGTGPLAAERDVSTAAVARLQALEPHLELGSANAERVARLVRRAEALDALAALAGGEREAAAAALGRLERPDAGSGPPEFLVEALAGAVAAVTTASDVPAEQALRALQRAGNRGFQRPERYGWQARARARAGLETPRDAEELLADLDRLAEARPLVADEHVLAVRARLALGEVDVAEGILADHLTSVDPALRWEVALVAIERALGGDGAQQLEAASERIPTDAGIPAAIPAARRREVLEVATRRVRPAVERAGLGQVTPAAGAALRAFCCLHRALLPDRPIPPDVIGPFAEATDAWSGKFDFGVAKTLLEFARDDLAIQRRLASQVKALTSGKKQRALLPAFQRALELTPPDDLDARRDLECERVGVLAELNDGLRPVSGSEEARQAVEVAGRLLPGLPDTAQRADLLASRSRMLRLVGDLEGSLADVDAALERVNSYRYRLARARTLEGLERYDEALKDAISYAQLDVSLRGTEIVWRLARKVGRPEAALPALKAIVARRPHYTDWQLRQAWVEARHVGLKEAAATVAAAGRRMKADGGALGPVGEACLAAAGRIPDLDVEAAQQVAELLRVAKDLAAGHAPADRVQAKLAAVAELTRPR